MDKSGVPHQPTGELGEFGVKGDFKSTDHKSATFHGTTEDANKAIGQWGGLRKVSGSGTGHSTGPIALPKGGSEAGSGMGSAG